MSIYGGGIGVSCFHHFHGSSSVVVNIFSSAKEQIGGNEAICGLKHFFCEGGLRHRYTREFTSNNLRAVGPNHA